MNPPDKKNVDPRPAMRLDALMKKHRLGNPNKLSAAMKERGINCPQYTIARVLALAYTPRAETVAKFAAFFDEPEHSFYTDDTEIVKRALPTDHPLHALPQPIQDFIDWYYVRNQPTFLDDIMDAARGDPEAAGRVAKGGIENGYKQFLADLVALRIDYEAAGDALDRWRDRANELLVHRNRYGVAPTADPPRPVKQRTKKSAPKPRVGRK